MCSPDLLEMIVFVGGSFKLSRCRLRLLIAPAVVCLQMSQTLGFLHNQQIRFLKPCFLTLEVRWRTEGWWAGRKPAVRLGSCCPSWFGVFSVSSKVHSRLGPQVCWLGFLGSSLKEPSWCFSPPDSGPGPTRGPHKDRNVAEVLVVGWNVFSRELGWKASVFEHNRLCLAL